MMTLKEIARQAAIDKAIELMGEDIVDAEEVIQLADAVVVAVLRKFRADLVEIGRMERPVEYIDRMLLADARDVGLSRADRRQAFTDAIKGEAS